MALEYRSDMQSALTTDSFLRIVGAVYMLIKDIREMDAGMCCPKLACREKEATTAVHETESGRTWRACLNCGTKYCVFCLCELGDTWAAAPPHRGPDRSEADCIISSILL